MPSGHPQPATRSSSPHIQVQDVIVVSSETESDSETEPESVLESHPDNEYEFAIQNQLGLAQFQHGDIRSSPPVDVPVDINYNELNSDSEFFLTRGL
jgi:hypothetical protein